MGKLIIKLQSVSDIITNSSSEVFLCTNNTEMTIEQLKEFIYEYNRSNKFEGDWNTWLKMSQEERDKYDHSGGMGGFLDVCTYEDLEEGYWLKHHIEKLDNPEKYLIVDTDWCHNATIKWITENLGAIDIDLL